jgi:hypothetical protein
VADTARTSAPPTTTPTPRRLYIHDDLSVETRARHGVGSAAFALVGELLALVRRDFDRVTVLRVEEQIEMVLARGAHAPFALAFGIGQAGERVAQQLNVRAGWFPVIQRVDVTREEDGRGGYTLASLQSVPLATQLAGVEAVPSLALVDDTVFSGLTLRTILDALPAAVRARTHAFCLRCVAETLPSIETRCPITPGFAAPGRILEEVSFINASGLVRRGAIRHAGRPPLAFFDRPEWIHAWFPGHGDDVIAVCRRLHRLLEPTEPGQDAPA